MSIAPRCGVFGIFRPLHVMFHNIRSRCKLTVRIKKINVPGLSPAHHPSPQSSSCGPGREPNLDLGMPTSNKATDKIIGYESICAQLKKLFAQHASSERWLRSGASKSQNAMLARHSAPSPRDILRTVPIFPSSTEKSFSS
ncbi:hypothetical protein CGRA01v4_12735 [Colletotrichum graminicola]|nr:hypothetical protein CGRA01v4_12735 [Colletotrichum graminicola]